MRANPTNQNQGEVHTKSSLETSQNQMFRRLRKTRRIHHLESTLIQHPAYPLIRYKYNFMQLMSVYDQGKFT